jgi:hypothetical protein
MGCTPLTSQPKGDKPPAKEEKPHPKTTKAKEAKEVKKAHTITSKAGVGVKSGCFIFERQEDIKKYYTFDKELGSGNFVYRGLGAFGVVFRATSKLTKDVRAIKALNKKGMKKEDIEAMLKEVEIMKELVNKLPHY